MCEDDPIKTRKDELPIDTEIIKAAGDDPKVKGATGNLGEKTVTPTKTINNKQYNLTASGCRFHI